MAGDLNRRGVPSAGAGWAREKRRTDGRWLVSALHAMLRTERYAGRVIWNRSQWVKDPAGRVKCHAAVEGGGHCFEW